MTKKQVISIIKEFKTILETEIRVSYSLFPED